MSSTSRIIDDDPLVFTMTATGYVKTTPAEVPGAGRGRGIAGAKLKDEDTITRVIQTSNAPYLLLDCGGSIDSRHTRSPLPVGRSGTAIVNLLPLQEGRRSKRSSTRAITRRCGTCSSPPQGPSEEDPL